MRSDLPTGTVTFCFTDVEGSTRLLHELGAEAYAQALAEHRALIREACTAQGGVEVDTQGDAFFFAFSTAPAALVAAAAFTIALEPGPIRVRVGIHTGTPLLTGEGYVGGDVHRAARIAAAAHGGQVVVSRAAAALLPAEELRDLGEHRFKDLAAPERVYQLGDGDFAPLRSLYRTNLPVPATPFLGRAQELAEVTTLLLDEHTRLVTLTGPGGTGKTRLALQAAAETSDRFPDGVYWVPLAPLRDAGLVITSVCQALGVHEKPGLSAAEALGAALNGDRVLLVLDNCEHVIEAAADLATVLARSSGLRVLSTSRETLRLQAEVEYPVPPLATREAIALFCERARSEPSDTIAELCARLDNLPLALELAAARLKLLAPEQLLERLGSRLDLLKGGRDADPRQQTLRATIEWSHDLLSPEERTLFRRLSVFRGGCTVEAAEAVCDADLETLESLLDKSLLRRRDTELGPRFWMLETIREYAAERLDDAGETAGLRDRHAGFFLELAESLEPPPLGGVDETWAARASVETDNLRAAQACLLGRADPTEEARLAGALFRFWPTVGSVAEGRGIADHALERSGAVDPRLRMKVLYAVSISAFYQGDIEGARKAEEQRLEIARAVGNREVEVVALNDLGLLALERGDVEAADTLLQEGLSLARTTGDERLVLSVSNNLGELAAKRGDYVRAEVLLEEGLAVATRLGDRWSQAHVLETLGFALLGAGDPARAAARFGDGLALFHVVPLIGSYCLDGLAAVAVSGGDAARAARLSGKAEDVRREAGFLPGDFEQRFIDQTARGIDAMVTPDVADLERARGAALTLDEAVAYALGRVADAL